MIEAGILLGICGILAGFLWIASRGGTKVRDTRTLRIGDTIRLHVVDGLRHVQIEDTVTSTSTGGFFLGDRKQQRHPWQDNTHALLDETSTAGTRWVEKL